MEYINIKFIVNKMFENRSYYLKLAGYGGLFLGAFATFTLIALYSFQNKILYMPSQPIKYQENNPAGYRNPSERGMEFKDVEIQTKDKLTLRG